MIPPMAREREAKQREGNEIEFSRIVAFSDGVFAIAITLLVLNLGIPKDIGNGGWLTPSGTNAKASWPTLSASR
jgi:uncharacterized membrane protein